VKGQLVPGARVVERRATAQYWIGDETCLVEVHVTMDNNVQGVRTANLFGGAGLLEGTLCVPEIFWTVPLIIRPLERIQASRVFARTPGGGVKGAIKLSGMKFLLTPCLYGDKARKYSK
jgi:hypothetical protein